MDVDRLAELRQTSGVLDTITPPGGAIGSGTTQTTPRKQRIDSYAPIQNGISKIQQSTEQLEQLKIRNSTAISERQRKNIMSELNQIIDDTNTESIKIKRTLDSLKPVNHSNDESSAKYQIELNMYSTYTRKFHDTMIQYNKQANEFKLQNRSRDTRMLKTIDPNMSDQRAEQLIDSGQATQLVQQALVSDDLQATVREIEQRHVDLLRLEQQVIEINELFKDLSTLVDLQQESLDVIENRIIHAASYTKKAEEQLDQAAIYAAKARRRACYICICLTVLAVILVAVLVPVFTTVINNVKHG